ncbi:MAG: sterol desaturase family protein [Chitinophagales bacterium]|jgi:sterol desaturase/sphingolipid hydroxylase (fatty acid hydroxylase superfamily)|nr:sterol desaturase family protein [Chitinophagales bacterium]
MEMKIKNKGQATLFQSKRLEILTKTTPQMIYSMYVPLIIAMLCYSLFTLRLEWYSVLGYYAGGMFFWTFFEYLIHRFVFHHHSEDPQMQKFMYTAHGVHHEFPRDKERLFMPPVPSLILASLIFSGFYFILHVNAFMFFPGFLTGYLIYGSMHYAIHAMAPPFKFMKAWWRYHHLHHYQSPEKGFGVSSPMWDHIFGTVPSYRGKFDNPEEG